MSSESFNVASGVVVMFRVGVMVVIIEEASGSLVDMPLQRKKVCMVMPAGIVCLLVLMKLQGWKSTVCFPLARGVELLLKGLPQVQLVLRWMGEQSELVNEDNIPVGLNVDLVASTSLVNEPIGNDVDALLVKHIEDPSRVATRELFVEMIVDYVDVDLLELLAKCLHTYRPKCQSSTLNQST
ncbi:hypothetical protein Fmac_018541 [Flemingia macrophylla]|uniref:Uncharacterized protein n=1 Tax=Flemingia macrophylla TaxID=520843 RepID=A0ABD1M591_9FABA